MCDIENPLEDLIALDKRINSIEEKCKQLQKFTDRIELRKHNLYNHFNKLEERSVPIPSVCELLITQLLEKIEKRKAINENWKMLRQHRNAINESGESMENLLIAGKKSKLTNNQLIKIEMMLVQFEQVLSKQEKILVERESILMQEENIIDEIENNLKEIIN